MTQYWYNISSTWNAAAITDIEELFRNTDTGNPDIGDWDTSAATALFVTRLSNDIPFKIQSFFTTAKTQHILNLNHKPENQHNMTKFCILF